MDMKRILYYITAVVLAAFSVSACDMFKLDNFDGPNAQISGRLLDAETGDLIGIEASTSMSIDWSTYSYVTSVDVGSLVVLEQGWIADSLNTGQDWLVRFDGQYRNNLVFAGDYKYTCRKLPCYEPADSSFTVREGANKMDLELLPYCRIVDPEFSTKKDAFGNLSKLVVKFKVELTDPTKANTIANVAFCANTQMFVGANYQNLAKGDSGAKKKNVTAGSTVTLEIDMKNTSNADLFRYNRERYLRVAAMANGNGYNSNNLYNFSKTYRISADFETIEEVEWDEI